MSGARYSCNVKKVVVYFSRVIKITKKSTKIKPAMYPYLLSIFKKKFRKLV